MPFLPTTFNPRTDGRFGKGAEWIWHHPDMVSSIISVTPKYVISVKSFITSDSQFPRSEN